MVVGEVLDTHHPHLPGRVFVRWLLAPEFEETPPGVVPKVSSNFTHLSYYENNGLSRAFPRMFFGTRLLGLMPRELAESLRWKDNAERLPNGTLQLDLVASPWASDPETLQASQPAGNA